MPGHRAICLCALMSIASAATAADVLVDGSPLPDRLQREIPHSAEHIIFTIGDTSKAAGDFNRMRFRLEGKDYGWRQLDGSAVFTVCFYDQAHNRFGQRNFERKGRSAGANRDFTKAYFTHRRETIVVPANAVQMEPIISSAGSPASVGVYLVKNVRITRANADGARETVFDEKSSPPSSKEALEAAWKADGSHPSMAQVMDLTSSEGRENVLALVDDDNTGHAEWRLRYQQCPAVSAGERFIIEWDEIYENSMGEPTPKEYGMLAPGAYEFRMQAVDVWGNPVGAENITPFIVPKPYWKTAWFWSSCAGAVALLILLGIYLVIRTRARRELQRARLLEQERLRIAQDLHDDLGARLTHLSLLSSHAENHTVAPEDGEKFREFSYLTRDLVATLSETVWTVNPKNDHLESLVSFLCRMIAGRGKSAGMRCRIDALPLVDHRIVPSDVRHHIILAVKEAVNNVFKHSGAEELTARIAVEAGHLHITISDPGGGFDEATLAEEGNGLVNMRERMRCVKGTVVLKSEIGKGTTVHFDVPIP
jgi:two-component sensor histidine kinase